MPSKAQRHRQIIKLIDSGRIANQADLAQHLERVGTASTQTTLSRDLAELGVVKSSTGYHMPSPTDAASAPDRGATLATTVRRLMLEVAIGGTQAVIHTPPGQASALAFEIDRASLPGVLGTIAGDDCIFVACLTTAAARLVMRRLQAHAQGRVVAQRKRSHAHS
ncbi:MAG: arginine repressor [Phycisphaerales bacterium]|nr:arginine repressor [Phycisphaerales bacterium]